MHQSTASRFEYYIRVPIAVITKALVALLSYHQNAKTEYCIRVLLAVLTKALVALLSYYETAETEYCF